MAKREVLCSERCAIPDEELPGLLEAYGEKVRKVTGPAAGDFVCDHCGEGIAAGREIVCQTIMVNGHEPGAWEYGAYIATPDPAKHRTMSDSGAPYSGAPHEDPDIDVGDLLAEIDRLRAEELRLSKLAGKQASEIANLQVELERAELKQMAADMAEIHRESRGRGPVERETFEAALLKIERVGERKKEAEQRAEAAEARVRELEDWLKRGKEAIRGAATRKPNGPFAKSMRVLLDEIDNGAPSATPAENPPLPDYLSCLRFTEVQDQPGTGHIWVTDGVEGWCIRCNVLRGCRNIEPGETGYHGGTPDPCWPGRKYRGDGVARANAQPSARPDTPPLVKADYSQLELRIVALLEAYEEDVHTEGDEP